MRYQVGLIESEEGYAVSCPQLGYHSQGATVEEALENIKEAIHDWLAVEAKEASVAEGNGDRSCGLMRRTPRGALPAGQSRS